MYLQNVLCHAVKLCLLGKVVTGKSKISKETTTWVLNSLSQLLEDFQKMKHYERKHIIVLILVSARLDK